MSKMDINMKIIIITIVCLITFNTCTTTEPEDKFELTTEDASCTEVWLEVKANGSVIIEREGAEPKQIEVSGSFTFYEDGLKPNTGYNYTAMFGDKKLTASITTLDTTSNNFTWQTFTFGGEAGSGKLSDVAIINENDIWAVGEINIPDTNENGYTTYNAVHWDGSNWELKKIPSIICGTKSIIYSPLYALFQFGQDNILFSDGGEIIYWNGSNYINV